MADAPATTPNKSPMNKTAIYIIIGLIALLLTVIIAGTVLIIYFGNMKVTTKTVYVEEKPSHNSSAKAEEFGVLVSLGDKFPVNLLNSDDGMEHLIEVAVNLEVEADKKNEEKQKEEVEKRIPMIRDLVITILRSKTKEKIDEKEGKETLRSEIKESINNKIGSNLIRNVYFAHFIIQ